MEIRFGSNKVVINYATDSHVLAFDNDEGDYLEVSEDYIGDIVGGAPVSLDSTTQLLTNNTLLPNYFNEDENDDNLQVINDANLSTTIEAAFQTSSSLKNAPVPMAYLQPSQLPMTMPLAQIIKLRTMAS